MKLPTDPALHYAIPAGNICCNLQTLAERVFQNQIGARLLPGRSKLRLRYLKLSKNCRYGCRSGDDGSHCAFCKFT
jgi:hypothetical protein